MTQIKSLGVVTVTTPGTPVQLTTDVNLHVTKVRAQVVIGQVGKMYLGVSGINRTTFAGVVKVFWPTGGGGGIADAVEIGLDAQGSTPIRLADLYVDGDVGGEGLIVSYLAAV